MTIEPVELVLRVARATVGACEQPPNSNAGPFVERVLATTGNKAGDPWCAAWVTMIGTTALGEAWPVKKTASVQQMCEWAEQARCRYVAAKSPAQVGDLFCLYYPKLKRWAHVGFVVSVEKRGNAIKTYEANTSGSGSREGWLVAEKTRTLTDADRLIRWANLVAEG